MEPYGICSFVRGLFHLLALPPSLSILDWELVWVGCVSVCHWWILGYLFWVTCPRPRCTGSWVPERRLFWSKDLWNLLCRLGWTCSKPITPPAFAPPALVLQVCVSMSSSCLQLWQSQQSLSWALWPPALTSPTLSTGGRASAWWSNFRMGTKQHPAKGMELLKHCEKWWLPHVLRVWYHSNNHVREHHHKIYSAPDLVLKSSCLRRKCVWFSWSEQS